MARDERHMRSARRRRMVMGVGLAMLAVAVVAPGAAGANPKTKLISIDSGEVQPGGTSGDPAVSANGRYVAFETEAALVASDVNGVVDVYIRDRKTGKTKPVSVRSGGSVPKGGANPAITPDGRYVAFHSVADDLVNNDGNGSTDVFVRDRKKKKTRRVSVKSNGKERVGSSLIPAISASGRFIAFHSVAELVKRDDNGHQDIYVHDRQTKKTQLVSIRSNGALAKDFSSWPSISADGRFVAFESRAHNLVKRDTNEVSDIFYHDRRTKRTRRASVKSNGNQVLTESTRATISPSGNLIGFGSAGKFVNGDKNGTPDVYAHNRKSKKTKRISVRSDGALAIGDSSDPSFSRDDRFVAFESGARLATSDTNGLFDIYLRDRKKGKTKRISVKTGGAQATGVSFDPSISGDGRFVAWESDASDLVTSDTFAGRDVFMRGPLR